MKLDSIQYARLAFWAMLGCGVVTAAVGRDASSYLAAMAIISVLTTRWAELRNQKAIEARMNALANKWEKSLASRWHAVELRDQINGSTPLPDSE